MPYTYPPNPQMITLARLSRGISLTQLANKINCKHLRKIELGQMKVTDTELKLISEELDYPIGFFCQYRHFPEGLLGERKICAYNRIAFNCHATQEPAPYRGKIIPDIKFQEWIKEEFGD
jgi:transcriptional regulator with XRE-family HTH domain